MTQQEALKALLAKVEAGEWDIVRDEPAKETRLSDYWGTFDNIMHLGSLDAAKALHDAVLPGWGYCDHLRRGLRYTSRIGKSIEDETVSASSDNPARAWLIAILKALIVEGDA